MTYKDLIDTLVRDSGDDGSDYEANAYRWLNFVRQECAARGTWASSKNSAASFTTDAGNLTGVYDVAGFDGIMSDEMYDQTNDCVIHRDTEMTLRSFDANLNEFGPPTLWSDAGMNSDGDKKVRFWPIPDAAYDIGFIGSVSMADIAASQELETVDQYFGALSGVGAMFLAGLRYYHDLNDNQDINQISRQRTIFHEAIKVYSSSSSIDTVRSSRLEPVGRRPNARPYGRLDPSHFSNR